MDVNLKDWLGRSEAASDVVTATPYAALSAVLDMPVERPSNGTVLPPLWHWLYFLPVPRQSEIGPDGHPKRGGFLPPVPLPRRMWAGSQIEFKKPLRVGDAVTRLSTIEEITEKSGRSGPLVFVRVRHELYRRGDSNIAVHESQNLVYRAVAKPEEITSSPQAAPATSTWMQRWVPDSVLLFRYSALTFNSHRIHYDRPYASGVEGYGGLVVHGPLIATLLLHLLRQKLPEAEVVRFEFRSIRPTLDTHDFFVCGEPQRDGKTFRLWATDHKGWLTMDATAVIAA